MNRIVSLTPTARVICLTLVLVLVLCSTGREVCGRFLEYWQQNGGLPQQGYPITAPMQERSDTDGQTYTVQYFERAVFELHPQNQKPYDVLLTLLGVYQYRSRYGSAGAPNQQANASNPLLFRETGKTIGGTFRTYWQSHGGLAQQGFPISDEFEEKAVNGRSYRVQYFQRAVFELHPENAPPFDVLLSLLGTARYSQKYNAAGTPLPAASPTPQQGQLKPGQGLWLTKAPIPNPRSEVAVAAVNGKIYVLGGFSSQGQAIHEEYDPATDRWRGRASLPVGLNHAGAVGLNGKLYMVGGFLDNGRAVANTYEYDPLTDKWQALAPMPTARGALGLALLDGKIYAIGGRDTADVSANEVYDPATNTWTRLAGMPTARDHLGVVALGGKIYAVGGRFETFARNTGINEAYDPRSNAWQARTPMPTARSGVAAVSFQGHMLVFGGERTEGTFRENEAYNPSTDSWTALAPMPTPRHGIGAAVVGNVVYIPSGGPTPGGSQTEKHEAFRLAAAPGYSSYSSNDQNIQENMAFKRVWERIDYPLVTGKTQRSWTWGPKPFATVMEPLGESPGGVRLVQYYDKGRMEINNPGADLASPWYVTSGLLVYEMLSGRVQVGYNKFEQHDPSNQVIAGDMPPPGNDTWAGPPTFATLATKATLWGDRNRAPNRTGDAVREIMGVDGSLVQYPNTGAGHCSTFAHYVPITGHNIPDAFWNYMNQKGVVYKDGKYVEDKLIDWVQVLGYPLTEPYYVTIYLNGAYVRDLMVQAFQRRLLTSFGCGQQVSAVQMGNAGLAYYNWRYKELASSPTRPPQDGRLLPFRPTYVPEPAPPGEFYLDLSLVSNIHEVLYQVAVDQAEWDALFKRHRPYWGPSLPVDFTNEFIVAAFGGDRPNSTNRLLIKSVALAGRDLRIVLDPSVPNVSHANDVNQPHDIIAVSKVTLSPGPYRAVFLDTAGRELSSMEIVLP